MQSISNIGIKVTNVQSQSKGVLQWNARNKVKGACAYTCDKSNFEHLIIYTHTCLLSVHEMYIHILQNRWTSLFILHPFNMYEL